MPRVPASERRADLVQAAIQVATREGLAATTTRRIAQELGISVGIVHYVFRSKEELLHEVIRVIADAQVVAAPVGAVAFGLVCVEVVGEQAAPAVAQAGAGHAAHAAVSMAAAL